MKSVNVAGILRSTEEKRNKIVVVALEKARCKAGGLHVHGEGTTACGRPNRRSIRYLTFHLENRLNLPASAVLVNLTKGPESRGLASYAFR